MSAAEALRKGERAGSVSNLRFMPLALVESANVVSSWTRDALAVAATVSGAALVKSTSEALREEGALGTSTQEPRLEMGEDGDAVDGARTDMPDRDKGGDGGLRDSTRWPKGRKERFETGLSGAERARS